MKNWSVLAAGSVGLLVGFAGVYWVWNNRAGNETHGRTVPAVSETAAAPAPISASTPVQPPAAQAAQDTRAKAAEPAAETKPSVPAPAAANELVASGDDTAAHDPAAEDHSTHDHAKEAQAQPNTEQNKRYEGGIEQLDTGYDLSKVQVDPELTKTKAAMNVPGAGTTKEGEWSSLLPPGENKPQKGKLEITAGEQTFDFGKIRQGSVAEHSFEFVSNGEEPLVVSGVKPSCGCTKAELMLIGEDGSKTAYTKGEPIPIGQRFTLESQINTEGKQGSFSAQISLYANDPRGAFNLRLIADVQPILVVTPGPSIFFGKITSADRVEQSITIKGSEGERFTLEPSTETDVEPLEVELTAIEPDTEGKANEWQVKVAFGPDAPVGLRNYPLRLLSDIPIQNPKYPAKDGTPQTHSVQLSIQAQVTGMVSAEPAFVTFGMVRPNEPIERTVRVESHDDFKLSSDFPIVIEGLQGQEFPYVNAFTTKIELLEEGKKADVKIKLDGLPADLNGSFGGVFKLKVGHPHLDEVVLRFSGVCRPGIPAANPTGGG